MPRTVKEWIGKDDDAKPPKSVRARVFRDHAERTVYEPRLLAKTDIDWLTGCWNWTGAHTAKGYGHIKAGARFEKVHRLAYQLYVADIPPGAVICHRCDNPRCWNPMHLWCGTQRENILDAKSKGRLRNGVTLGEANHSSKLTEADVAQIRAAPKAYGSGRRLAARFGVREATICHIRAGRSWRGE
jgi:hypothetical protein